MLTAVIVIGGVCALSALAVFLGKFLGFNQLPKE